jgi:hypothetical protein
MAAAQEETNSTEPATPKSSVNAEATFDPDAAAKAADGQIAESETNATDPNAPVGNGDDILYTIQDNEGLIAPGPSGTEDENIISTQNNPDFTLTVAVIGIAVPIIIGTVIGFVVYHRKQADKPQITA